MATDLQKTLHITTRVGPGHKIEIETPQWAEGDVVEVFVTARTAEKSRRSILEFLGSLPRGPRSYPTWEEFEKAFQEERNAWDR